MDQRYEYEYVGADEQSINHLADYCYRYIAKAWGVGEILRTIKEYNLYNKMIEQAQLVTEAV